MKRILMAVVMVAVLVGASGCALFDRMGARALAEKFWDEWTAGASGMETLHDGVTYQFNSGATVYGLSLVEGALSDWGNLGGFEILQVQESEVASEMVLPDPVATVVFKFTGGMTAFTPAYYWCTLYVVKDPWKVLQIHITTTDPLPL